MACDHGLQPDPVDPAFHTVALRRRNLHHLDRWIHASRVLDAVVDREIHVRQQVHLVQQHHRSGAEHIRIFQRLVLALGDRQHDDLVGLAEIERRRAHEIADVLDEKHRIVFGLKTLQRALDHAGVEMAALAGIDLQCARAGRADPVGVVRGLLVALDHRHREGGLQAADGLCEQRGLARTGTRNQVECEDAAFGQEFAVEARVPVVLRQDVLLDLHHLRLTHSGGMRVRGPVAVVQVVDIGARVPVTHDAAVGQHVLMLLVDRAVVVCVRHDQVACAVSVAVDRAVGMHVLMLMRGRIGLAFDLRFPAAASTGRAHRRLRKRSSRHFDCLHFHFFALGHLQLVAAALRTRLTQARQRHARSAWHAPGAPGGRHRRRGARHRPPFRA